MLVPNGDTMSGQTWTMNSMNVKSTRPKQTYTIVNKETLKQTNTKINWTLESIYQQNNQPTNQPSNHQKKEGRKESLLTHGFVGG